MSTSYYTAHHSPTPTIHHLIQNRANAISSIPFSQTSTTFFDIAHSPGTSPLIPPRGLVEISPTASSPSLYSRVGHSNSPQQTQTHTQMLKTSRKLQVLSVSDNDRRTSISYLLEGDDGQEEEEEDDDPRRMSMVGGPRVRKYTQVPWEEDENEWSMVAANRGSNGATVVGSADMFSGFGKHNKSTSIPYSQYSKSSVKSGNGREREQSTISTTSTILSQSDSSSLNVSSTRRGLAQILGVGGTSNPTQNGVTKHLVPSASGLSLASNQTSSSSTASSLSDVAPITPKLKSTIPPNAVQIQGGNSPTFTTTTTNLSKQGKSRKVETFHQHQGEFDTTLVGLLPAAIPKPPTSTYKKPTPTHTNETLSPNPNPTSNGFAANDRPLMSSGSPGFGLITLEAAQERERMKSQNSSMSSQSQPQSQIGNHQTHNTSKSISDQSKRPLTTFSIPPIPDEPTNTLRPTTSCSSTSTPSSPPTGATNKVKSKKSGLMRLFNKSDKDRSIPVPPVPHGSITPSQGGRAISIWSTSENSYSTTQTQTVHGESAVWPRPSSGNTTRKVHGTSHAVDDDGNIMEEKDKLGVGMQPKLELRPVSMTFSRGLPVDYLVNPAGSNISKSSTREGTVCSDDAVPPIPHTPASILKKKPVPMPADDGTMESVPDEMNRRINNAKKAFKIQIYELEAQIRELKDELREARARKVLEGNCDKCGCTCNSAVDQSAGDGLLSVSNTGSGGGGRKVIDRARVKTAGARGVFGSGSLYEWE